MTKINFFESDGTVNELDVDDGWTLMHTAVSNGVDGVDGIDAECGGSCCCATCHGYVDEPFVDKLIVAEDNEFEILGETAAERKVNSRLAYQIKVTADMDGIKIQLPEVQS